MKKVLFLILCCAVFAVGCSKAVEEQPAAAENMDQTAAVSNDVTTSTDTVAVSTEAVQGEVK
jgi:PBP1b-binding outer membrane lipoprotein LpoB